MNESTSKGSVQRDILREQVRLAMQQVPTMQAAAVLVAAVLAFLVRDIVPIERIAAWLVLISVVAAGRTWLFCRFRHVREEAFSGEHWRRLFLSMALASGTFWGLSAFLIFPAGDKALISLFVLVIASVSATTTVSHSAIRLGPTVFAAPAMMSYAVRCIWEGGEFCLALAALILLYLGTVLRHSFKHRRSITGAIALRFENLNLLNDLKDANKSLQNEIAERMQGEAHLRVILESTADGILAVDAEGRVIKANRKFMELWRVPPEVMQIGDDGVLLSCILHQLADPQGFLDKVKSLYGTAELDTDVLAFKDGRVFERFSAPLMRGDAVIGRVWSFRDITERKRVEKQREELEIQLRQAQKMEAIGALAGGIAHDFNNILAAIIGNIELAQLNDGAACVAEELAESLRAAGRAKDLVKQILAFSRQTAAETMPVRAAAIAGEALKLLRATIPSSIEIRSRIDESSGSVLSGSVEIHQILMNLCTNAVHAMGSQGALEVEIRDVTIDAGMKRGSLIDLELGPHVRISVRDSGHGIDPEVIGRIFDPYFTTKDKEIGTGLGLAVVHGIVKKNGGAMAVASEVGKGTVFDVYLPAVNVPVLPNAEQDLSLVPGKSERILLVDDEKMLVDMGRHVLHRLGYAVVTRTSPVEALELFRAKPDDFDLVVTDQTMPGMSGDALARELMRLRPGLPVIICTGYSRTMDEQKAALMGISGFVLKPLSMHEISVAVRKALDRAQSEEDRAAA